jgi:hypothetical protein
MATETEWASWGCRVENDEGSGEPRVIMLVPRRTQDEMREIVRGLIDGSLLPSTVVPDNVKEMVFMPVLFGALRPPTEAIIEALGSAEAPETIEGDPKKPEHPGHPNRLIDPPAKPTLAKPDPEVEFAHSWDDLEEGEWEAHLAEVEAENQRRIREWEKAHDKWMDDLDKVDAQCREIDAAYQERVDAWMVEMAAHQERNAAREKVREEWLAKHSRIFSRWAEDVGCLLGDMKNTFPRAINGFPMFHALSIVHREDWERIDKAARREIERMENIEV